MTNWEDEDVPNPGSDEALDKNCTCPILDNNHGDGWMGTDRFYVSFDCPLHATDDEDTDESFEERIDRIIEEDRELFDALDTHE